MSDETRPASGALSLPDHPDLDWLRKQAKRRLDELRVANPSTQLSAAQFDLARQYGFTSWRALKAHIDALTTDGQLFDAARSGVYMADAHVDHFDIQGMDSARAGDLGRAADVLMNQLVRDVAIYSFRMEDLRYAGTQFVPTRLDTIPGALVVTVEPAR